MRRSDTHGRRLDGLHSVLITSRTPCETDALLNHFCSRPGFYHLLEHVCLEENGRVCASGGNPVHGMQHAHGYGHTWAHVHGYASVHDYRTLGRSDKQCSY